MGPAALTAIFKQINKILLAGLDERLVIGALCGKDYYRDAKYPHDTIKIPVDLSDPISGIINFRLRLETVEFNIPDVTEALLSPTTLDMECNRALDHLCGCIERDLLTSLDKFTNCVGQPYDGITAVSMEEADRVLFDAGYSGPRLLITGEYGWQQLQKNCGGSAGLGNEVCSPSPEDEPWLHTSAMMSGDAVYLVTRRLLQNSPVPTAHAETDSLGLTVTAAEGLDGRSLQIKIHLLFAAGIVKDGHGIRIPVPEAGIVHAPAATTPTNQTLAVQTAAPTTVPVNPFPGDPFISLSAVIANPVIDRFRAVLDSLSDTIPDNSVRLSAALRLIGRTDNIGVERMLECCTEQFRTLSRSDDEFRSYMESQRRDEISSRMAMVKEIDTEAAEIRQHLEGLALDRARITGEIEDQETTLGGREEEFTGSMCQLWDSVAELETTLIMIRKRT